MFLSELQKRTLNPKPEPEAGKTARTLDPEALMQTFRPRDVIFLDFSASTIAFLMLILGGGLVTWPQLREGIGFPAEVRPGTFHAKLRLPSFFATCPLHDVVSEQGKVESMKERYFAFKHSVAGPLKSKSFNLNPRCHNAARNQLFSSILCRRL